MKAMLPATLNVTREEARAEVGRVLLARESLAYFAEYVSMDDEGNSWYTAYKMHQLIAHELEQVLLYIESGGKKGTQFLMVLTPPQHGKSALISRMFPAFAIGKLPNLRVLEISYGADLASEHSKFVRNLILSDRYKSVFGKFSPSEEPVALAQDSKAAAAWDLAAPHRGGMIAVGVGGAVPGRAKGLVVWDDPIKGHKEAQSKDVRDDAWDFYVSALRVRTIAGVLVMTHWSDDDPAGRIMKQMVEKSNSDQWKILCLPGLIEENMFAADKEEQRKKMLEGVYLPLRDPLKRKVGEALCPEILSKAEMLKIREQSDFYFSALYQQQPYPKDGQKYKRAWFETVKKMPDDCKINFAVRYWDKANSKRGDYTVGALMCYCSNEFFYLLDIARIRDTSYGRDEFMKKVSAQDAQTYGNVKIWHQQDPGQAGKDAAEATNRMLMGYPVKYETVSGDKAARSEGLESAFQGKHILLIEGNWNEAFISECVAFTGMDGGHDDQVDAASSAYHKLIQMIGKHKKSKIL
jgi:predicted phage terminase large subunit-like protein